MKEKSLSDGIPIVDQETLVDLGSVLVPLSTAFWLAELSAAHGDTPQNMAASILIDVERDDRKAHGESAFTTLQ